MLSPHVSAPLAVAALCGSVVAGATTTVPAPAEKRAFNLPRGDAAVTLKQFAAAAGTPIVYLVDRVRGATTNAVTGDFAPRDALECMLAGSGLEAAQDAETGAFVVSRKRTAEAAPSKGEVGPVSDPDNSSPSTPMEKLRLPRLLAALLMPLAGGFAQSASPASPSPGAGAVVLSPFQVSENSDVGYQARETLSGTRLNSSLKDIAAQITVMTPEFLQDLAITDLNRALFYSLNTESDSELVDVSGPNIGGGYSTEYPVGGIGVAVGGRTRGIGPPNRAHDFFDTVVPIDSYNTERFTFASGPNSILFGNAQPSGTIDTTFKRASAARASRTVELRFDDLGSSRAVLDVNQPVKKDMFAVRLVALRNRNEDWREAAFDHSDRLYATATFKPLKSVSLRGYYERSEFHLQAALESLLQDHVTPWIEAGRPAYNNAAIPAALPARTGVFAAYNATNRYYAFSGQGSSPAVYGSRSNMSQSRGYDSLLAAPYSLERSVTDESIYPYDVNYSGNSNQMKATTSIAGAIGEFNPFKNLYLEVGYNRETYQQRFARFLPLGNSELFVDANRFLQDRITPNPNFGRYYIESPAARAGRNLSLKDQARLSLSYEVDLGDKTGWQKWIGRHRLATLLDRNETEFYNGRSDFRVLGTPAGVSNSFFYTYYVDPGDRKNLAVRLPFDPLQEGVIDVPGVDNLRIQGWNPAGSNTPAFVNRSVVQSRVLSWQGFLFNGRLGLTWGRRADKARLYQSAGDLRRDIPVLADDPQWQLVKTQAPVTAQKSVVAHLTPWSSVFFTESDSQQVPNIVRFNLDGTVAGIGTGEGKEYGFSLRLLHDRLSLRFAKYDNVGTGSVSNLRVPSPLAVASGFGRQIRQDSLNLEHNALRQAAARGRNIASDKYRVLQETILATTVPDQNTTGEVLDRYDVLSDSRARGYELTIVGNITKDWRLSLGGAKNEARESNIGLQYLAFVRERLPVWIDPAWRNEFTVAPATGTRITALEAARFAIQNYDFIQRQEGRAAMNLRKYRFNATTRYGFAQGPLKGMFVGANCNWRSPLVAGYKWINSTTENAFAIPGVLQPATSLTPDTSQPIYGSPLVTFDGFAGYTRRILDGKVAWRVQLNVRNLLNNADLIRQRSDPDGMFVSSAAKEPRNFILTNSFDF